METCRKCSVFAEISKDKEVASLVIVKECPHSKEYLNHLWCKRDGMRKIQHYPTPVIKDWSETYP